MKAEREVKINLQMTEDEFRAVKTLVEKVYIDAPHHFQHFSKEGVSALGRFANLKILDI